MAGLHESGIPDAVAQRLWANFEATGDYSFNKSHAACYALIAYRTAWLKANHPVEYMAALISSVMNTKDKVPFYVNQCHSMGIEVLPPDVNESAVDFTVVGNKIRFGLNAVKGVGKTAIEAVETARATGPFADIYDFCARVDTAVVNKRALEALVKCGAFDSTGHPRRGILEALPMAVAEGDRLRKAKAIGQTDLFSLSGGSGQDDEPVVHHPPISTQEFPREQLLQLEKEALGLYVSSHPLEGLRRQLHDEVDVPVGRLATSPDGAIVWTGGVITGFQRKAMKSGATMVVFRLEDVDGGCEVFVFADLYEQNTELLREDAIVKIKGRIDRKAEDDIKLRALEVKPFDGVSESRPLRVVVDAERVRADVVVELKEIFAEFPGTVPVVLTMITGQGRARLRLGDRYRVDAAGGLYAELKALLGDGCIELSR
jgi:DNA polymerase III subunit alpha